MTKIASGFGLFQTWTVWALALLLVAAAGWRYWELKAGASGRQARPELLVETSWLAGNLSAAGQRIVDTRGAADYAKGHIPGAVHIPREKVWTRRNGVNGMLPPVAELQETLRAAGIGKDTRVIAYDAGSGLWAARFFWALDVVDQNRGRLLDGGFQAWSEGGNPVSTQTPRVTRSDFVANYRADRVATADYVKSRLGAKGTVLLDARSPAEYAGTELRSRRGGHIPGAVNVEWRRNLGEDGKFQNTEFLGKLYSAFGVDTAEEVVPYCQTNVRAAHAYFTLKLLGYDNVRNYDGSWEEWGNRDDLPLETGSQAAAVAPPPAGEGALALGTTIDAVRALTGEPDQVEATNPCWGSRTVWRFRQSAGGHAGPLRLVFINGKLTAIEAL